MNEMRKLMESANKLFESMSKDERSQLIGRLQMALDAPLHRLMALSDAELLELAHKYLDEDDAGGPAEFSEDENGKLDALEQLQDIQEQLADLSEQAQSILRRHFQGEYRQAMAYDTLNFGGSINPHDTTFTKILDDLMSEYYN